MRRALCSFLVMLGISSAVLAAALGSGGGEPGQAVTITVPASVATTTSSSTSTSTSTSTTTIVIDYAAVGRLVQATRATTTTTTIQIGTAITATAGLPTTGDYHAWPDWPLWRAVGLCEQRGDGAYDSDGDGIAWHGSPAGGLPGSGYPGGLGLGRAFWSQFAPQAGVVVLDEHGRARGSDTAGAYASPGEQIRVARAGSHDGTRMGGWSSWPHCVRRYYSGR